MPEMRSRPSFLVLIAIFQASRKLPLQTYCGYDLSTCIVDSGTLSLEKGQAVARELRILTVRFCISMSDHSIHPVHLALADDHVRFAVWMGRPL
jgi:hypothetical protein